MTENLIITCLYSSLWGTKIGGRPARHHHYINGLSTLTNLGQDMVVYTSESDKVSIEAHFKVNPPNCSVTLIVYDLFSDIHHEYYQPRLSGHPNDRCFEIMHNKFFWMKNHIDEDYKNIYWFDCGLTHGGLFPLRLRESDSWYHYYTCKIFNSKLIEEIEKIQDGILICYGDQTYHGFEAKPSGLFFNQHPQDENCHIVGGFFGGKKDLMVHFLNLYDEVFNEMKSYNILEREEHLMTVVYFRNKKLFKKLRFTTWHPEDNDMGRLNNPNDVPFYKIFEDMITS